MKTCRHNFDGLGHCDIGGGADYCVEGPCVHEDLVEFAPVVNARWASVPYKLARICPRCQCDEPYKNATDDAEVFEFCPHCGAQMDGGDGNEAD